MNGVKGFKTADFLKLRIVAKLKLSLKLDLEALEFLYLEQWINNGGKVIYRACALSQWVYTVLFFKRKQQCL